LYARHVNLDPSSPTGFSVSWERWVEPTPKRPTYAGQIAVLMGRANMSSAEAFLLMMKQAPRCKLIGERSFGASGNPQPHLLANGVTVYLPSWKAMLPDGTVFEGKGIAPDIEVLSNAKELQHRDPVLEKAKQVLSNHKP
jgi:C-terminal processing protease CtpA/Prc